MPEFFVIRQFSELGVAFCALQIENRRDDPEMGEFLREIAKELGRGRFDLSGVETLLPGIN